jgi:EAL and modified HD-GYP domain-containing signal transduction protein
MNEPLRTGNAVQQAYIERQPIVDRNGEIVGYELYYYPAKQPQGSTENTLEASAAVLAHLLGNLDAGWLPEGKRVFLNTHIDLLTDADFLALLPDNRVVLDLHGAPDVVGEEMLRACDGLRRRNIGIALDGWPLAERSPELLIRAGYVKLDVVGDDAFTFYEHFAELAPYPLKKIAKHVGNGKEYRFCRDVGFDLFQGYFFTRPEIVVEKEVSTSLAQLVQLFDLVGANAEPKEIEAVFKRDPTLVLKLLGYINSAGMGVGRKVTSIGHAIQILGYRQLYRWVALLLYTAGSNAAPSALMKTVLARSRFIEIVGRQVLPKHEQDNLFMVGMLSLLDVVFGLPLDKALAKLPLLERISRAILDHEGIHGQLLRLAEAVEGGEYEILDSLATSLRLELADINAAQMEALGWAESLAL